MSSLAFIPVDPGQQYTRAAKHEERGEIHSHAQRVTQHRKREHEILAPKVRCKQRVFAQDSSQLASAKTVKKGGHVVHKPIRSQNLGRRQFGLAIPSPEPDFDRPLTNYSAWTDDQKYGISIFSRSTVGDLNTSNTDSEFWTVIVPAYGETWECVRDIVSANACAYEAVQRRDDTLSLRAEHLHLRALSGLRRDLMKLPLPAQLTCCLLLEAYSIVQCDLSVIGKHVDSANLLARNIAIETYRRDDFLRIVYDTVRKMSAVPMWSWWSEAHYLRFKGLRVSEPDWYLHLEVEPINTQQGICKGLLVEAVERLGRHLTRRIRRNLSERAYIDPSSQFAFDVVNAFGAWKIEYDLYSAEGETTEDKKMLLQAELVWNITYVIFCTRVLGCGEMVCDKPPYRNRFVRINQICAELIDSPHGFSKYSGLKVYLCVLVPTLWMVILMCRHPDVRAQAIAILYRHEFQENDFNSIVTARLAERIVELETCGRKMKTSDDLPEAARIRVEKIGYDEKAEEAIISYSTFKHSEDAPFFTDRMPWVMQGSSTRLKSAVNELSQLCIRCHKVKPVHAPLGYVQPMIYQGKYVPVLVSQSIG